MREFNYVKKEDPEVYEILKKEYERQSNHLEMIASENLASEAVMETAGSYHILKYSEGYAANHRFGKPGRYYAGCENIDAGEELAIKRVCELFNCNYANVQPHSGAQANTAVQFAICKPGDTIMGMSLNAGGHLTHGAKPTFSGKYFNAVQYEVNPDTLLIDYNEIEKMIYENKPRLFIAGASAYPRQIDFEVLGEIINKYNSEVAENIISKYNDIDLIENDKNRELVNKEIESKRCYFMVDMAHIAGLVATGLHPSPIPYADVVTSTTHKTLRGPRGGIILTNNEELAAKIDKAVFPGVQGGPLENMILAKAVAFGEALKPEFKEYQQQVINNAKALADRLLENKVELVSGGTDNHLVLIDLRNTNMTGLDLETQLSEIGIITNKNGIPFDTKNKATTSGLRIGTPAVTARGLKEKEMIKIADIISGLINQTITKDEAKNIVNEIIKEFPLENVLEKR